MSRCRQRTGHGAPGTGRAGRREGDGAFLRGEGALLPVQPQSQSAGFSPRDCPSPPLPTNLESKRVLYKGLMREREKQAALKAPETARPLIPAPGIVKEGPGGVRRHEPIGVAEALCGGRIRVPTKLPPGVHLGSGLLLMGN